MNGFKNERIKTILPNLAIILSESVVPWILLDSLVEERLLQPLTMSGNPSTSDEQGCVVVRRTLLNEWT
jgi:hypothetical protein